MARSIEYLVSLFPEKTGKEIIELHNLDKLNDKKEREESLKDLFDLIKHINSNGYYKGSFSTSQYYMYYFNNLRYKNNFVIGDVETIVCFYDIGLKDNNKLGRDLVNIKIEVANDKYDIISEYGLGTDLVTEISKEEYESFKKSVTSIVPKYFPEELKQRLNEFGE
jgi:hypothetical protein